MLIDKFSKLFSELISSLLPFIVAIIGFAYMVHGKPRDKVYTWKDNRNRNHYFKKENLTKRLLKGLGILLLGLILLGQV